MAKISKNSCGLYKFRQAFSLVEISVVILIIGILITGISSGIDLYSDFRIANARNLTASSRVGRISDLALWVEATSEKSFSKSEAKDGKVVNAWFDIGIQSIDKPILSASGNKAVFKEKVLNSLPALYFNGSGWFEVQHLSSVNLNNKKTYFVVLQTTSTQRNYVYDNSSCTQNAFIINSQNGGGGQLYSGQSIDFGIFFINRPYIVSIFHNDSSSFFRYNGFESTKSNAGTNPMQSLTRLGASCVASSNTENFIGYIGEFIMFDRVLNSKEYLDIENYLSKKWSIKI